MVSDSAIFRIASKKLGIVPVVNALMRGNVTVGAVALAVNGYAVPCSTWLLTKLNPESFPIRKSLSLYLAI